MYPLLTRIAPWANDVRAPVLQDHGVKNFSTDQAAPGGKPFYARLVLQIIPYHQASAAKTIHIHSFVSRVLERPALLVPQEAFSPGKGFHQFKTQAHEAFLVREHHQLI